MSLSLPLSRPYELLALPDSCVGINGSLCMDQHLLSMWLMFVQSTQASLWSAGFADQGGGINSFQRAFGDLIAQHQLAFFNALLAEVRQCCCCCPTTKVQIQQAVTAQIHQERSNDQYEHDGGGEGGGCDGPGGPDGGCDGPDGGDGPGDGGCGGDGPGDGGCGGDSGGGCGL
ncbi:MAG: hypothetical protein AAF449_11080 [Myxococcota bacterium]